MSGFLSRYRRLLAALARVECLLGALLIINVVANIGVQVFSRYLFNYPLIWVEELATYSFIWATFLGASLGLKQERHIRIEAISGQMKARTRALLKAFGYLVILVLLLILLPQAWSVSGIESRSRSISLPIALPRSWFYSIPLMVGATLMALTAFYLLLVELTVAAGKPRPAPISGTTTHTPETPVGEALS